MSQASAVSDASAAGADRREAGGAPSTSGSAALGVLATLGAATSLAPLVEGVSWFVEALVVVVVLAATGALVARAGGSAVVCVVAQVAAAAVALTVVLVPTSAVLGIVPGPATLEAVRAGVDEGFEVIRTSAPPVPDALGLRLVVVASLAVVALAVDVLAVRLGEAAAAGAPLAVLFVTAAALSRDGVPWWAFVAAASTFLLLLSRDGRWRASRWGRTATTSPGWSVGGRPRPPAPLPGAHRVTAAGATTAVAVLVALAVPLAAPQLGTGLLGTGLSGTGDGGGTRVNPLLTLAQDLGERPDVTALTYRVRGPDAGRGGTEPLRLVSVDTFDGETWEPDDDAVLEDLDGDLPTPPGLQVADALASGSAVEESLDVRVGELRQEYLPAPYPLRAVDVTDGWQYREETLDLVGTGTTSPGQEYTVDYTRLTPDVQRLADSGTAPAVVRSQWTDLPDDLPEVVAATAGQVAAEGTPVQQAARLQDWFRNGGGFAYSEQAPGGTGSSSVAAFLERRTGYCVHFASSMALMARTLDIPARVSVGFLPGQRQGDGSYRVSLRDAHAWPELYFAGTGWVRFEPTPGVRTGEAPAWTDPVAADQASAPEAAPEPVPTTAAPDPTPPAPAPAPQVDAGAGGTAEEGTARPGGGPVLAVVLVALALAVLLAAPAGAAAVVRRRRWERAAAEPGPGVVAEQAWQELRRTLADLGHGTTPGLTPRQEEAHVLAVLADDGAAADGGVEAALGRLRSGLERARYAPPPADRSTGPGRAGPGEGTGSSPDATATAPEDVRSVVAAARRRTSARRRCWAAVWPASVLGLRRPGSGGAGDATPSDRQELTTAGGRRN